MKKQILLFITHYFPIRMLIWISTAVAVSTLFIGVAFSQSGWIVQSPLPTNLFINVVKYVDYNIAIALAGPNTDTWEGIILKTTNNGISWNIINSITKNMLWDLYFINENTGYAVGDSMIIIKTVNGGNNWFKLYSSNSSSYNTSVFFLNENTGYVHNDSDRILKTTNGGVNWIYLNIGYQVSNFANVFFVNENTGFIPRGWYCLKTTNGGESWNQYTINTGQASEKIYFMNELTGFAVGHSCIISKTTNGGINWILTPPIGSTATLYSIIFINNTTGFAAGGNIVAKTTDKGDTWSKYISPSLEIRSIGFSNEYIGLTVGTMGEITKTTNGGNNWDLISSGTFRDIYTITFAFAENNIGYSFAMEGEIIKTTNGGTNWIKLNPYGGPYYFNPYFVNSNTGIARTYTGICKTTNGGINWIEKIGISTFPRGLFFLNPSLGFASSNGFYKTLDTGET
ncbi:MAG: YCF48-related protein, partial [Ignavibacteriae bacterium]|nr:YCF48-related protein [Ignavibacteriota bacterium]